MVSRVVVKPTPLAILAVLAIAYATVFIPNPVRRKGFDPHAARPRVVEELISARQFSQALPLALELQRSFPNEAEVAFWVAAIHHGLGDSQAEATALEDYARLSSTLAAACPALPAAYERLGDRPRAVAAYERCLQQDPQDPDRVSDLAGAYQASGRTAEALELYRHAVALDPYNPSLARRLAALDGDGP